MWSGPRNISTTLMYSFAQRSDTKVYDEPLYAFYLKNSSAKEFHPGAEEIMGSQENSGKKVIQKMLENTSSTVQFYKQMTHHLLDLDLTFLKKTTNILLTRNPVEMLPSFVAVIKNPTLKDVGYSAHCDLVKYFIKNEIPFIVIDSTNVLLNPREQLIKLCKKLEVTFDEAMLSWEKGARAEDGVWAKYWYKSVHNSTGFKAYEPKHNPFPIELKPLLEECSPYYKQLKELAI